LAVAPFTFAAALAACGSASHRFAKLDLGPPEARPEAVAAPPAAAEEPLLIPAVVVAPAAAEEALLTPTAAATPMCDGDGRPLAGNVRPKSARTCE
jgi:hypothetical protein